MILFLIIIIIIIKANYVLKIERKKEKRIQRKLQLDSKYFWNQKNKIASSLEIFSLQKI
jgi:hypothetical protein